MGDQFGSRVEPSGRCSVWCEVGAKRGGCELDGVEDVCGTVEQAAHEVVHVGGLPVVGDDAVPLAEHVGEAVDLDQRDRHVPGGVHGGGQPLPDLALVLGGGAEVTDEVGDLRWSAFAFHEQHAVELDGAGLLRSSAPSYGLNGVAVDGSAADQVSASACKVRAWRCRCTASSRGAEA